MSRLGGVKGWAREWRQQGEGAVGREGLSPRFWPWKSCAHHQWISGIILLLPILITTMYLSKYLQACKMALGSWGWHSALTLGTCWSGPSTPHPTPVIMSSLGYPPSPYGDDFIYEQPSTQSLFLSSPIQTAEEIARSRPGACSKEEKRECWSSFSPLQLFLPLKYKVTENLEIDKLDWQPVDKTVLLL